MMNLRAINVHSDNGCLLFNCHFDDPAGSVHVDVVAEELLSYAKFQLALANRAALIFHYDGAEGRSPELADHFWRKFVSVFLDERRWAEIEAGKKI